MTQEDKNLLLKDLCARLPYGVRIKYSYSTFLTYKLTYEILKGFEVYDKLIIPYLRPMSSMTEEEKKHCFVLEHEGNIEHPNGIFYRSQDYLNSIYVDYRGLIPMGLALEAPEGMY